MFEYTKNETMKYTTITSDGKINAAIDSDQFNIEHTAHGAVYYIEGIDVCWDFSVLTWASQSNPTEWNDEIEFNYSYVDIKIQDSETGEDIEEGSNEYAICMRLLNGLQQFELGIEDYINSEL